jgi:hypothetical protein
MPVDANVDGIHAGVCDRQTTLAEEDEDAIDRVLPLPGSAVMNEGGQRQQHEVCMTNM